MLLKIILLRLKLKKSQEQPKEEVKEAPKPTKSEAPKPKSEAPKVKHQILEFPALSPTMTVGKIISWTVKPGDKIKLGSPLAEIETDKATLTMESTVEGFLAKIYVQAGTEVKVGEPIGIVVSNKDDINAVKDYVPSSVSSTSEASPPPKEEAQVSTTESPSHQTQTQSGDRILASPLAKKLAQEKKN